MSWQAPPQQPDRGWRRLALVTVKTVHTAAFLSIAASLGYFTYAGAVRRSDRRAAIAGAVVAGEALLYAANGFRCPLTDVAQRLGDGHPSVADIYLPRWVAGHIPHITAPMYTVALALHTRNLCKPTAAKFPRCREARHPGAATATRVRLTRRPTP